VCDIIIMMNIILIIHIYIMLCLTIVHYHNAFHIRRYQGMFTQTKHFLINSDFYQVGDYKHSYFIMLITSSGCMVNINRSIILTTIDIIILSIINHNHHHYKIIIIIKCFIIFMITIITYLYRNSKIISNIFHILQMNNIIN
jgi:hypothetical protein